MAARVDTSGRSGREVIVCERATKRYDTKAILDNANFTIERGMRVGVVGPNGVGKSTLVEMIVGEESPDTGYLRVGHGVTVAYHKQEADDFDDEESVLDTFYDRAGMTVGEARSHLAKFLFTGEDVFKPISALSGGERSKLALALMVLSPANLLILDEPTNHLDVYSCDALTEALQSYKGTLLVVSHDRALLDAATDTTLALPGNGKLELFEGAYSAWRAEQEEAAAKPASPVPPGKPKAGASAVAAPVAAAGTSHGQSKERQKAVKRVATVESEIAKIEARISEIETALSAPESVDHAIVLAKEYETAKKALTKKFEEWETATLEAEALGAAV
jgi:ATP-binding cassette subfamily F protein 3